MSEGRTKEGYEACHPSPGAQHRPMGSADWESFEDVPQRTWVELDEPPRDPVALDSHIAARSED